MTDVIAARRRRAHTDGRDGRESIPSRSSLSEPPPPRLLPILYFGVAHAALALAFGAIAVDPGSVIGFFYHPRMLAIVHLVTVGWITSSILGALYLVGPIALRMPLPACWPDYLASALVGIGMTGIVSHFWIVEYSGMAWSGGTVALGVCLAGTRVAGPLRRAPLPRAVKLHIVFAFANFAGAATMGVLLGINKMHPFLPGFVLGHVFAHAHLAAVGWAAMMVVGIAYRLLPMVLPARMPAGPGLYASAALLEIGVAGLFAVLFFHLRGASIFATTVVAGFAAFFGQVMWMLRHPRPRPPAIRAPDPAVLHAGAAFVSLVIACGLGLWLSVANTSESTLRVATAYGVFGLLGFLAQMVVAMEGRLLPLLAWFWASSNSGQRGPVPSPHDMPWRAGQLAVFVLWLFGIPALAGGLAFDAVPFVRAAAWALLSATVLATAQAAMILRHAYIRPRPHGQIG